MALESQHLEFKSKLTDSLEREVVGFLNSRDGGQIMIGIDDDGAIVGLSDADGDQLKIKDRLKHKIQPSCMGLFDVLLEQEEGKNCIKLIVASGQEKPYYLRKLGMSPRGCFIRVGSATEPMTARQIDDLFASRTRNSLGRMESPRQDLRFTQLKIYYQGLGFDPGQLFTKNLELERDDGTFNYAGYLLADVNSTSIKFAKYSGVDRVDLLENEEYGNCCLVKAASQLLDRLEVENLTRTKITARLREERRLFDPVSLREAVINAIVHNDYSYGGVPKVELFENRLEITSTGGIPRGLSEQEFLAGYSIPVNKELMRVFRDLGMVEHLGSGMPRILRSYPPDCFHFSKNFIRIVFPAEIRVTSTTRQKDSATQETTQENDLTTQEKLIRVVRSNPSATREALAKDLGISPDGVKYHLDRLRKAGRIKRLGSTKSGRWKVLE